MVVEGLIERNVESYCEDIHLCMRKSALFRICFYWDIVLRAVSNVGLILSRYTSERKHIPIMLLWTLFWTTHAVCYT